MKFVCFILFIAQFLNLISNIGAQILNSSATDNNIQTICSNYYNDKISCFAKCKHQKLSEINSNIRTRILCVDICSATIMWTTLNDTKNNTFAIQIFPVANQSAAVDYVSYSDEQRFTKLKPSTEYQVLILKISLSGSVLLNDISTLKFMTQPAKNPKPPVPSWFNISDLIPVNETFVNVKIKWNFTNEALPCRYEIFSWLYKMMNHIPQQSNLNLRLHEVILPNLMYEKTYEIWMMSRFQCAKDVFENRTGIIYSIPSYCKIVKNPSVQCSIPQIENVTEAVDCNYTSKCLVNISWSIRDFQPDYYSVKIDKFDGSGNWSFIKAWNISNSSFMKVEVSPIAFYQLSIVTFKNGSASSPYIDKFYAGEAKKTESNTHMIEYYFLPISVLIFLIVITSRIIRVQKQKNNRTWDERYLVEIKNNTLDSITQNVESKKGNTEVQQYFLIPGKMLGKGNFGIVFHGTLMRNNKKIMDVAVKTLQDNTTIKEIQQFEKEISLMQDVGFHNNIVCMIGSCYHAKRPLLIVEFCSLGDLHTYLCDIKKTLINFSDFNSAVGNQYQSLVPVGIGEQNSKCFVHNKIYGISTKDVMVPELSICDLLSFARQVAIGMEYLASIHVVHRDLAARNVLLCNDKTVKISDFGLSRDIYTENIYRKLEGSERMPIKWIALESIRYQEYTTLSDVWSFGIFLWELFTMGDEPYPDISCPQVLYLRLKEGYRMANPCASQPELYEIMLSCWQEAPELRPQFSQLYELLDQMLKKCSPNQYITVTGGE